MAKVEADFARSPISRRGLMLVQPKSAQNTADFSQSQIIWRAQSHLMWRLTNAEAPGAEYHRSLQVGVAALNSARFPVISPAGMSFSSDRSAWVRVVDGGYFDNSGAATLLEALRKKPEASLPKKLVVARINGNAVETVGRCSSFPEPSKTEPSRQPDQQHRSEIDLARDRFVSKGWSVLRAYTEARTGHAQEAVEDLHAAKFPGLTTQPTDELRLDYEAYVDLGCRGKDANTCGNWMALVAPASFDSGKRR